MANQQNKNFEELKDRYVGMAYTGLKTDSGRNKINILLNVQLEGKPIKQVKLFALEVNGRPGEYAIYRKDFEHQDIFPCKKS